MKLNTHQVQKLVLLADLLDMLQNPNELKSTLKELKSITDDYHVVVEKQRRISNIDSWYRDLNATHAKAVDSLAASQAAFDVTKTVYKAEVEKQNKELASVETTLAKQRADITSIRSTLSDVAKETKKLDIYKHELEVVKADLDLKERVLTNKLRKVEELLGGTV